MRREIVSVNLKKGSVIARNAFVITAGVGIAEVFVALFSRSVALLADGVHALATAIIFLIVWIGLRLSGRSPDGTFHFGYYRFESLGSLVAAFLMTVFGGLVLFEAYSSWMTQRTLANPEWAVAVALASAVMAVAVSSWISRASKEYGSTSLRTAALNGSLDFLSSVGVSVGVILSAYFGILHADSIAGILIAAAIFWGAYSIFKEASLVLADACRCGDVVTAIADLAKGVKGIKEVHSVRMRSLGPYLTGDMHIVVDSNMLVREADEIATAVEDIVKKEFQGVKDLKIRIESDEMHNRHSRELIIKAGKPSSNQ